MTEEHCHVLNGDVNAICEQEDKQSDYQWVSSARRHEVKEHPNDRRICALCQRVWREYGQKEPYCHCFNHGYEKGAKVDA